MDFVMRQFIEGGRSVRGLRSPGTGSSGLGDPGQGCMTLSPLALNKS